MNSKLRNVVLGGTFIGATVLGVPALAADGNLMQLTIQTEEHMAGMGAIPAHTLTRKVCMSAGRFDPEQLLQAESQTDCKLTDYKKEGNVVTFDQSCTKPAAITSHGEIHLTDTSNFTGTLHTEMSVAGHIISVDTSYKGERVGTCDYTSPKA